MKISKTFLRPAGSAGNSPTSGWRRFGIPTRLPLPSTLKARIVATFSVSVLLCCILMTFVSYNALRSMQENKIESALRLNLDEQVNKLDQTYAYLLQITQQMSPEGTVGSLVQEYFLSREPFDRLMLSRDISSNLNLITFSNPNVLLLLYFDPSTGRTEFGNYPTTRAFTPELKEDLSTQVEVTYQAPHRTLYSFSDSTVVSLRRSVRFDGRRDWYVYAEAKTDLGLSGDIPIAGKNLPIVLLLTDDTGMVRYSSDERTFPSGAALQFDDGATSRTGYARMSRESRNGYSLSMMIPLVSYNRELSVWTGHMFLVVGGAAVIVALSAFLLWQLIMKPLQVFEREMNSLGRGDLVETQYKTGISEYDRLFGQFNEMKRQIQQLLIDVATKEKRRHQLEIEMLGYQINPHFLFNVLNSVHWMAMMSSQTNIASFVSTLNYLLSYNLGKSKETVTMRTEIKVLQAYLELQHMRYDFEADFDIEEGPHLDVPVARFILQPIAENAICHGLDEHGRLEVRIAPDAEGRNLLVRMRDDGKGMSDEVIARLSRQDLSDNGDLGRGIGLRYVRMMLESFYGDLAEMRIANRPGRGTEVLLTLPLATR